jgi:hypothetical protein
MSGDAWQSPEGGDPSIPTNLAGYERGSRSAPRSSWPPQAHLAADAAQVHQPQSQPGHPGELQDLHRALPRRRVRAGLERQDLHPAAHRQGQG